MTCKNSIIKKTSIIVLAVMLVCLGGWAKEEKPDLVITNARLIDGTGAPPVENAVIVIGKGKFKAVGAQSDVKLPERAKIIDVKGKTVVPGLIDAHVHMAYPPNMMEYMTLNDSISAFRTAHYLHRHLMGGITTVRSVADRTNVGVMAKKAFEDGMITGSRPFVVGQGIVSTGGHGAGTWEFTWEADGPDEFRKGVRLQLKSGVDLIKLLPPYSYEEAKAAIEETHFHEKLITVHSGYYGEQLNFIRWAIELGADCVEHAYKIPDDVIQGMAQKDVACVPTLAILLRIAVDRKEETEEYKAAHFKCEDIFKKLKKAGVKLAVGTDAIFQYLKEYPGFYFDEVELFVKNGCTPMEAIVSATKTGAEVCDAADRLGTVEKGKIADLLVIEEDPLQDIRNLRKVKMIVQDGKIIKQQRK